MQNLSSLLSALFKSVVARRKDQVFLSPDFNVEASEALLLELKSRLDNFLLREGFSLRYRTDLSIECDRYVKVIMTLEIEKDRQVYQLSATGLSDLDNHKDPKGKACKEALLQILKQISGKDFLKEFYPNHLTK